MKSNKLVSKSQPRFRSEKQNVFTEEVNKIELSVNNNKRMQLTDAIETYSYGTNEEIIHKKEEVM